MSEPDYWAQCGEISTDEEGRSWIERTVEHAKASGMAWGRVTRHAEQRSLVLYEGWKVRPEDEGDARFAFTPS